MCKENTVTHAFINIECARALCLLHSLRALHHSLARNHIKKIPFNIIIYCIYCVWCAVWQSHRIAHHSLEIQFKFSNLLVDANNKHTVFSLTFSLSPCVHIFFLVLTLIRTHFVYANAYVYTAINIHSISIRCHC